MLGNTEPEYLDTLLRKENSYDGPVSLILKSPTRLIDNGKLIKGNREISFSAIIESIIARLRDHYGSETESLLLGGSVAATREQAKMVSIKSGDLSWVDIFDDNGHKHTGRRLGGKIGTLIFNEPAGRFWPLLKAAEILHIGKNAASGCGRIAVSEYKGNT
jgi:hypothetical protein